jgi:hypothetical protein
MDERLKAGVMAFQDWDILTLRLQADRAEQTLWNLNV